MDMASDGPPRMPGTASKTAAKTIFEYFLYCAIILETGLAAFVYKVIFREADLPSLKAYLAIVYFGFLTWAIAQLNKLHRLRTLEPETVADRMPAVPEQPAPRPAARHKEQTRPILGLTIAQFAIVIAVFATAVATFSWALSLLRSGRP